MKALILLLCDRSDPAQIWSSALERQGMDVALARSADEARERCAEAMADLSVIDLYASPEAGIAACQAVRGESTNPILLFSSDGAEAGILMAYQSGVDECLVRPLTPGVLLAKVRAWLRRSWTVPGEALDRLEIAGLCLDPAFREATRADGQVVRLTNLELRVLDALMRHPHRVLLADALIERVWGYAGGDSHALRSVVYRLRRKIEPDPSRPHYIESVPGGGYSFRPG